MAMTYTLFEYAKENADELMADHQISMQVLLAGEYVCENLFHFVHHELKTDE
jgi:hypothetical protein